MVYAQDRAAAWFQFIVVTFVLQLFLREEGDIEGKGPVRIRVRAGGSQAHAVSLDVHVIAVVVASVFLLGNSAGSIAILHEVFVDEDERPAETYNYPDLGGLHESGYPEYLHFSPSVAGIIPQWGGVLDLNVIDDDETTPVCLIHGTEDNTVPYDSGYCFGGWMPNLMPYMYGSHTIAERFAALQHPDFELHPFILLHGHLSVGHAQV